MNKMKLWLEQTMMISFAIFVGIMLEGVVYALMGDDLFSFSISWIQILSVILTGALCSIPTSICFTDIDHLTKSGFLVRLILHCAGLYVIVALFGWIFKWFVQLDGFIMMTVIYFLVYVFVWLVTGWFYKRDDKKINKALDDIRDED